MKKYFKNVRSHWVDVMKTLRKDNVISNYKVIATYTNDTIDLEVNVIDVDTFNGVIWGEIDFD